MAKKDKKEDQTKTQQAQQPQPAPQGQAPLNVLTQYVKDLSFENPNAPETLRGGQKPAEMNVNINMEMRKVGEDKPLYEVTLRVSATAKREENTDFIAEITYAVLAQVGDMVPEEQHHPMLLIECPKLAFPFVRQLLGNMTQQGGYPPLLLNPVDFEGLYRQQYAQMLKQQQAQAAQN